MKRYSGAKAEKSAAREQLPIGAYIAQIISAKEEKFDWGARLLVAFDIAEGSHKGFYQKDFDVQTGEDKKWRGVYRLYEPKDDGSEKDEWTKRTFNNFIYALEDSNRDYHMDWGPIESGDFSQLKGKSLGILFRNEEWEMDTADGYKTGWSTRPFAALSTGDVKDSNFKMPNEKPLKNKRAASSGFAELKEEDGELPF